MKTLVLLVLTGLTIWPGAAIAQTTDWLDSDSIDSASASAQFPESGIGTLVGTCPAPDIGAVGLTWDGDYLWVGDMAYHRSQLFKVDPVTCIVIRPGISFTKDPMGLAWDGSHLYYSMSAWSWPFSAIRELDPVTGARTDLVSERGTWFTGMTVANDSLWVANATCWYPHCEPDEIIEFTMTGTPLRVFDAVGDWPTGLAFDGRYLWHSDAELDRIFKLDPDDLTVLDSFPSPGPHPNDMAWDGRHLWVADYLTNLLYKLDVGLPHTEVAVDILPRVKQNIINLRSRRPIPVAVLGSETLDVTEIDIATLRFGPKEAPALHAVNYAFPQEHLPRDVNGDGHVDLTVWFLVQQAGIACGDESATLKGETDGGEWIQGSDRIETVGCNGGGIGARRFDLNRDKKRAAPESAAPVR